jgi:hypothetical protein
MGVVVGCVATIIALNSLSKYADEHMDNEDSQSPKKEIESKNQNTVDNFDFSNLPRKDINLIESRFKNK